MRTLGPVRLADTAIAALSAACRHSLTKLVVCISVSVHCSEIVNEKNLYANRRFTTHIVYIISLS